MPLRTELREWRRPRRPRGNPRVRRLLWKTFFALSLMVALFFGASWVSYDAPFSLTKIVLIGLRPSAEREMRQAEAAIARAFAHEGARLFSPLNIFLYPRRALLDAVASSSSRIVSAAAFRGGGILVLAARERAPFAAWCGVSTPNRCVSLDENGFGFSSARGDPPPAAPLIFFGGTPRSGAPYLPAEDFVLLRGILSAAERVGLPAQSATRGEARDFFFILADGSELRFALSPDAPALFLALPETLSAAHLSLSGGVVSPPLRYLDLRFKDQVVFKRK